MNTPGLKYYNEFKQILASYQVSNEALEDIKDLQLVLLLAPSAGGRNTVIRHLLKTGHYYFIVSDTTRKPRVNDGILEQNGHEYWFRTEEEMLADLKDGKFLEAELIHNQQVSGISIRELEKAKQEHKIAITDVELEGVHNVLKVKKDSIAIMLLPPSFDIWQNRIFGRGTMSEREYKRRLETAKLILEDGLKQNYYRFVINDNIDHAAQTIEALVQAKPNPQHSRGIEVINELQFHLQQKLSSPYA